MNRIRKLIFTAVFSFMSLNVFAQNAGNMDVAVFNPIFKNCSESEVLEFESVLRGRLVTAFSDYSRMNAFDGTTRSRLIEAVKKSSSAIYDERTILQAGRQLNATYMCYIKIIKIGYSQFNVYYNLLETATGIPIATFEDDCNYSQIINTNQNSITNRAVYKMLKKDLGKDYYVETQLTMLGENLAEQQADSARQEAQEKKESFARAEEERKKAEKERKQVASQKKQENVHSKFMEWQGMNPTSGIDIGGGMNYSLFSGFNGSAEILNGVVSVGAYISPSPCWGTGIRYDYIPLGYHHGINLNFFDLALQVDSHICIGKFFSPYIFANIGYGGFYDGSFDEKNSLDMGGLVVGVGGGLYIMLSKSIKFHGEYSINYDTAYLGWTDRTYLGFTWNPFGAL